MPTISPLWTVSDTSANSPASDSPRTSSSGRPVRSVGRGAGREDVLDGPAGHLRDQVPGRRRLGVQVHRRGAPVLEHGHPVTDVADLLQPVRDVDDRDPLRGEVADHPEQVGTSSWASTALGSSMMSSRASLLSARAMLTICFAADGSFATSRATGISPWPSRASTVRASARICPRWTNPNRRGSRRGRRCPRR